MHCCCKFQSFLCILICQAILFSGIRAYPIEFSKIFQRHSDRTTHYTIFSPDNAISENSLEYRTESVIVRQQCTELALNRLNSEESSMPVIICGNKNETMFRDSVEQIAATIVKNEMITSSKWSPVYFLVWLTVFQTEQEAAHIMKITAKNYSQNFKLNSQVYVVFTVNQLRQIQLWEFYCIGKSSIYQKIELLDNRIQIHNLGSLITRRANFKNQTIRATAQYLDDYELDVKFRKDDTGNLTMPVEFISGMNVETLQFLQSSFNFSIQPVLGTWDSDSADKTTQKIPDQLQNGIADISIAEVFVTTTRSAQFKFLHPTYADSLRAVYIIPPVSDFRDIFVVAFQRDLWIALACVYFFLIVIMKLFLWITILCVDDAELGNESVNSHLYSESVLFVVGVATQQGWHIQPESKSIRIIFLASYLTGLVCFVAYSAAIVSTLSVKLEFVKSFENLLNKNYRVVTDEDQYPEDWLHEIPDLQGLEMEILTASKAMNKVVTSKATFVTHADEMYITIRNQKLADDVTYTESVICERVGFVPLSSSTTKYAMFLKKGSYLADFFNSRLLRQRECGVLHRLLIRHIKTGRVSCNSEELNYHEALGLADVFTAFIILAVGYLISLSALVIEKFFKSEFKCF